MCKNQFRLLTNAPRFIFIVSIYHSLCNSGMCVFSFNEQYTVHVIWRETFRFLENLSQSSSFFVSHGLFSYYINLSYTLNKYTFQFLSIFSAFACFHFRRYTKLSISIKICARFRLFYHMQTSLIDESERGENNGNELFILLISLNRIINV